MPTKKGAAIAMAAIFTAASIFGSTAELRANDSQPDTGLEAKAAAGASNQSATETVRATVNEVLRILRDPQLAKPEKKDERRQLLIQAVSDIADFEDISSRVLGKHWKTMDDKKKKEFVAAFKDFLSRVYADKMAEMANEEVKFVSERLSGDYAEVKMIVSPDHAKIPMDYRLSKKTGSWKAYDVIVDNISLVNNYRSQFDKVIRDSSVDALIQKLREKKAELGNASVKPKGAVPAPMPSL